MSATEMALGEPEVEVVAKASRRRRFRITTHSDHPLAVAPNVLAWQFAVGAPDTAWVTDITDLWTREGWLYLAVILDLFCVLSVSVHDMT